MKDQARILSPVFMLHRFSSLRTLNLRTCSPRNPAAMYTVSSPPAGPTTGHSSSMVGFSRTSNHSPTNLARWSILNRPLLGREAIKTVHIYDFDNTCEREKLNHMCFCSNIYRRKCSKLMPFNRVMQCS